MSELIFTATQLTLGAIGILAIRAVLWNRDARTLDVAFFAIVLAGSRSIPGAPFWGEVARSGLFALQAFLLFRIIGHFRAVWRGLLVATCLASAIAPTWRLVAGGRTDALRYFETTYLAIALGAAAVWFFAEANRSAGVKPRRLVLAGIATVCLGAASALVPFAIGQSDEFRRLMAQAGRYLEAASVFLYFFSFSPPRSLVGRWRRREQAEYVGQSAEREPEERGWLAAQDLVAGTSRALGTSLALVAKHASGSPRLMVAAVSSVELGGWSFEPGEGLVGQAIRERRPVRGRLKDCEPEVAAKLAPAGELVLVAPLVGHGEPTGVAIAVHRRGALFPDDDLAALAQMARSAAVAIDHAALIRERRLAAQEASARRLRQLELRVDAMVDSIRDYAMLVVDAGGTVAAWHMGAENVFGYTREQIARRPAASLFGVSESEFATWLAEARGRGVADREGQCVRFDRTAFTGMTTIRPLTEEPGLPPGFVVVTRDVTDHRRLEERLRQGQKMVAIGALAGGVAHDFNNILAAIIGHADWLESEVSAQSGLDQVVEIQRSAERGVDLVQQLLAFSRREPLKAAAIDLSHQVRDMLPMLRRLIPDRIEIVDGTSQRVSAIWGSRSQVEQVILNLAVNARDAMPVEGRLTFRTADCVVEGDSTSAGAHSSHVLLEVADTGVGMDEPTRRRAFEPFFTTKSVGEGTGLGLATVYGIVQDMRGLVEIDSQVGRGTTIRVYFPLADERQLTADRAPADQKADRSGPATVLLVEDDASLRSYLVHVLESQGYRVLPAAGPKAALSLAAAEGTSLRVVLSDVALPGMDGPGLVAELTRTNPGLAAVFMSGHGDAEASRFGAPVASRWLQKPFSPADLLHEIERALSPS